MPRVKHIQEYTRVDYYTGTKMYECGCGWRSLKYGYVKGHQYESNDSDCTYIKSYWVK